jgi:predicted dehydrogenase
MKPPIRVGIIGCGNVAAAYQYHLQILIGQGLVEVSYVCDEDQDKAEQFSRKHHIPRFSGRFQDLIDSPHVDLILVLTSMHMHAEIARMGLLADKHVLVEKPIATGLEAAVELLAVASSASAYLLCAPFVALSPTYQMIWQRVRRGDVGKVLTARARYGHAGPTWGGWYYRQGGGALFDLAPYNLTSLAGWLGAVKRVSAFAGTAIPERLVDGLRVQVEIEDNAHLLLDFGASVYAVVTAGFTLQQYRCPAIELYGSEGTIQLMGDDWNPEGYELFQNTTGSWQIFKETDPGWLWTDGVQHLVNCILEGIKPIIRPEQAYHVLEILVRAKESARDGQMKTISSNFPPFDFSSRIFENEPIHLIHDRTHQRDVE